MDFINSSFPFRDLYEFVTMNGTLNPIHHNKYIQFSNQNNNFRQKVLNFSGIMFAVFFLMGHPGNRGDLDKRGPPPPLRNFRPHKQQCHFQ